MSSASRPPVCGPATGRPNPHPQVPASLRPSLRPSSLSPAPASTKCPHCAVPGLPFLELITRLQTIIAAGEARLPPRAQDGRHPLPCRHSVCPPGLSL